MCAQHRKTDDVDRVSEYRFVSSSTISIWLWTVGLPQHSKIEAERRRGPRAGPCEPPTGRLRAEYNNDNVNASQTVPRVGYTGVAPKLAGARTRAETRMSD